MAQKTIRTNDLTPGDSFMVAGRVMFSKIAVPYSGESLIKANNRRTTMRMSPIDRPYTEMTICDAQVVFANPNNKSAAEIYAEESLYVSKSKGATGYCYTATNRGVNIPWVGQPKADGTGKIQAIDTKGQELAAGLNVTLVMRVFESKPNNGVTLDGVICNEAPKYRTAGNIGAGLEKFGLTLEMPEGGSEYLRTENVLAKYGPQESAPGVPQMPQAPAQAPGPNQYGPAPNAGAPVPPPPPSQSPFQANAGAPVPPPAPAPQPPAYPGAPAPAPENPGAPVPGVNYTPGYPQY
mgnify:CR=1 FL=1